MKSDKKALSKILVSSLLGFFVFSCGNFSDVGIPESVAVKSNARHEGALGQKYYNLSEKLGSDFIKDLEDNAGADVYKYIPNPNDQTLSYLLHKKLYDVPLDMNKYIEKMDLSDSIGEKFKFTKEIDLQKGMLEASVPYVVPSPDPIPVDCKFNFDLDKCLSDVVIGEGSLSIEAAGTGAKYEVDDFELEGLEKDGDKQFDEYDFGPNQDGAFIIKQSLDLAGAKVKKKEITVSAKLAKKSGVLTAPGNIRVILDVKKIASATADLSNFGKFVMDDSDNVTPLPKEMVTYVQNVSFGSLEDDGYYYKQDKDGGVSSVKGQGKGISFKAVNSLPAGNDLILTIESQTFGIDSTVKIYDDGVEKTSAKIPAKGNEIPFEKNFSDYDSLDIKGNPDCEENGEPKNIQFSIKLLDKQPLVDLDMGKVYKIEVSESKMLFDWDAAIVDLDNADPFEDKADLSDFSIEKMLGEVDGELSKLVENCDFNKLPVYFLVQRPEGFLSAELENTKFRGKISLAYKDSSDADKEEYIAGSETEDVEMNPCASFLWPSTDQVISKVFSTEDNSCSFEKDIASTLNKRPKDLSVNYNMEIEDGEVINLNKAKIDSMGPNEKTSFSVELAAVIPLSLKVNKETNLDIYKIAEIDMGEKKDLMYRTGVSDTEKAAKYAAAVSYFRLNYNFINTGIDGFDAMVVVDDTHEGEPNAKDYSGIKRSIKVTGGDSSDDVIDFNSDEIKAVLSHFFMPKMTLVVPPEILTVKRRVIEDKTSVGVSPIVVLQLNDSTPIVITDIIK